MVVNLINGPADGMKLEYFIIPERVIVDCSPLFSGFLLDDKEVSKVEIKEAIYQRIGNTLEYICISESKGDDNDNQ